MKQQPRRNWSILAIAVAMLTVANAAHAVIRVRTVSNGVPSFVDYPAGSNITIPTNSVTTQINVWSTTSTEDIGELTVTGSGTGVVQMIIGAGVFNFTNPIGVPACGNLDGIVTQRNNVWLYGRIGGNLTDTIEVDQLWRFGVDGALQRSITSIGGAFWIDAGSISSTATLNQTSGGMGEIICAGTMAGSLVSNGGIARIDAGILSGSVSASGVVTELNVTSSLSGSLSASRVINGLVGGNLSGDLSLSTAVASGDAIRISGSLTSTGSITLPASGLVGQTTINNGNSGGTWAGVVSVGTTDLTVADYSDTAASLGGGSVGLAPFALHDESCDPVNDGNVDAHSDDPFNARHYGRVDFTGSGAPVLAERRVLGTSTWTDQTAGFTFSVTGDGAWFLTGEPISGYAYQDGYEHRVTPIRTGSDRLFCDGVAGEPAVADYTYTFTVGTECVSDINGDGVTNTADLGLLLGNFDATGLSETGDMNNDGVVNTADLGLLVGGFGACGESLLGGGGPGEILEQFGFESLEDYIEWLGGLTEQEVADHVVELIGWIEE